MPNISYIDNSVVDKRVLLRVDYNVSLTPTHKIGNDTRIRQTLPTIEYLLASNNKLILLAHLGEPKGIDSTLSLEVVRQDLSRLLPDKNVTLFPTIQALREALPQQEVQDIFMLENIRFLPGEGTNDPALAKLLASLGDIYVNDAFSVSHREAASIVGVPSFLPHYGGMLLKKEVTTLEPLLTNPDHPFVVVLGGAKISSKLPLLTKLSQIADTLIVGGGIANTLLSAQGYNVGESLIESEVMDEAKVFLAHLNTHHTTLLLPCDVRVGERLDTTNSQEKSLSEISSTDMILDIGSQSELAFAKEIESAKTILWNGPLGYFENPLFRYGTDSMYEAIVTNASATSIIGGGETIAALSSEEHLERITHISTGGGAMLEYLEKGSLPGIDALY